MLRRVTPQLTFRAVPFSGTPFLFQQQQQPNQNESQQQQPKPKRSQAAMDALRRSAELNTGEAARSEAVETGSAAFNFSQNEKSSKANATASFKQPKQKPVDPFEPDDARKGFNVIDEDMLGTEFLGFIKKGANDDESKPDGPLPCDSVGKDEGGAAAAGKSNTKSSSTATNSNNNSNNNAKNNNNSNTNSVAAETDGGAVDATAAAQGAPNWQDKKKLWKSLKAKQTDFLADQVEIPAVNELEYMRIEQELKTEDRFHWRLGQIGIDDEGLRNDYYALHILSLKLNKCRWYMMDIANKKGMSTTAIGMRGLFWKESCHAIIDAGRMTRGQFVDSHPVLRPFGECMQRRKMTKSFAKGFVDSRLKVMDQPANMKQLFDHFDKFHGHFLCMQLELLGVKSEVAEHIMIHLGRAIGITQHCVMLWRDYARLGKTLLPADICAANHVNLSLLRNLRLASVDSCVRRVLYEVMNHVRSEMKHVRELVPLYPAAGWPLLLEALYPNYYLNFLEHFQFDVMKRFADQHQYTYGFYWFMQKQMIRWSRTKDVAVLVDDTAPAIYNPMLWSRANSATVERVKAAEKLHDECNNWEQAKK